MSSAFNQYSTIGITGTTTNTVYVPGAAIYVSSGSGVWLNGGNYWNPEQIKIPSTNIPCQTITYPLEQYLPTIYTIKKDLELNLFDWIVLQYLKTQDRIIEID